MSVAMIMNQSKDVALAVTYTELLVDTEVPQAGQIDIYSDFGTGETFYLSTDGTQAEGDAPSDARRVLSSQLPVSLPLDGPGKILIAGSAVFTIQVVLRG